MNDARIAEDIREEIKNFLELYQNKNTTYQSLWEALKAVLRGTCIAWSAFNERRESKQNTT